MPNATEKWLPVVGFEDLAEVSDHGRVKVLERVFTYDAGRSRRVPEKIRKGTPQPSGHIRIELIRDGKRTTLFVHRLVLEAFVGPCPEGMEACHRDDNPANNHLSNLRWDTRAGNAQDRIRNGTNWQLKKTHCPRGHNLAEPNLVVASRPARDCLACARGRNHCRTHNVPFDTAIADRYYDRIMLDAT